MDNHPLALIGLAALAYLAYLWHTSRCAGPSGRGDCSGKRRVLWQRTAWDDGTWCCHACSVVRLTEVRDQLSMRHGVPIDQVEVRIVRTELKWWIGVYLIPEYRIPSVGIRDWQPVQPGQAARARKEREFASGASG